MTVAVADRPAVPVAKKRLNPQSITLLGALHLVAAFAAWTAFRAAGPAGAQRRPRRKPIRARCGSRPEVPGQLSTGMNRARLMTWRTYSSEWL